MRKFRKAFCPNPAPRFDSSIPRTFADEVVYVCDHSIFDNFTGDENKSRFEGRVKEVMTGFDPRRDVILFFGDALIFAMMIFTSTISCDDGDPIVIGRFSTKLNNYIFRNLDEFELI